MINNVMYSDKESVEIDKLFYNSIKDLKLLSNEEKIKLQALRFSKNIYFRFLDDYGKVDTYLQGLIDLQKEIDGEKALDNIHRTQLINIIEKKKQDLEMEEEL